MNTCANPIVRVGVDLSKWLFQVHAVDRNECVVYVKVLVFGVSVRTLQNWEQGRSQPSGAAQTLIKIAQLMPEVLRRVAA